MAARAIWKAEIRFGRTSVPVRLYSAVADRGIHFRLLHESDRQPVEQRMVNPETDEVVPPERIRKGVTTEDGIVMLSDAELEAIEPEPSREIEVERFVPDAAIDHRWYLRPYWVGPDGGTAEYAALAAALAEKGVAGQARWTMRGRRYQGALRARDGHLLLVTIRHAGEVVSAKQLEGPGGRALEKREKDLALQLVEALAGPFDPADYEDAYRARVETLIAAKKSGKAIPMKRAKRKQAAASLEDALAASLKAMKGEKVA